MVEPSDNWMKLTKPTLVDAGFAAYPGVRQTI